MTRFNVVGPLLALATGAGIAVWVGWSQPSQPSQPRHAGAGAVPAPVSPRDDAAGELRPGPSANATFAPRPPTVKAAVSGLTELGVAVEVLAELRRLSSQAVDRTEVRVFPGRLVSSLKVHDDVAQLVRAEMYATSDPDSQFGLALALFFAGRDVAADVETLYRTAGPDTKPLLLALLGSTGDRDRVLRAVRDVFGLDASAADPSLEPWAMIALESAVRRDAGFEQIAADTIVEIAARGQPETFSDLSDTMAKVAPLRLESLEAVASTEGRRRRVRAEIERRDARPR